MGAIFAAHAAVALPAANQQAQLEKGMETRDVIGQAKGILMASDESPSVDQEHSSEAH